MDSPSHSPQLPRVQRLLLIDDSATVRIFVQMSLAANGYEVHVAENAAQGLQQAHEQLPDVILLDAGLPDAQPEQVVAQLRRIATLAKSVILLFSAQSEADLSTLSQRCGVAGYVQKTYDAQLLEQRIQAAWARVRGADA